ncbi:hypothetical protein D3C86_1827480 [compost metagenome]
MNNNLIGFCVAIKKSYEDFEGVSADEFEQAVKVFEVGFDAINASKVNLGKYRRMLSKEFFENYDKLSQLGEEDLTEYFAEFTS